MKPHPKQAGRPALAASEPTPGGRGSASIKEGLANHELGATLLINADPVRTHPDSEGWRKALGGNFVVAISCSRTSPPASRTSSSRPRATPRRRARSPTPTAASRRWRDVPLPEGMIPGWRFLDAVATALGQGVSAESPAEIFDALSNEVPFYDSITYEESAGPDCAGAIGTRVSLGRRAGRRGGGPRPTPPGVPPATPSDRPSPQDLVLGTYRDLWAADVTKRNPALRFLMPKQKLELAAKDAEALELASGDEVTVAINGHSIEATVAIRERMKEGAAFLIEGTDEANANVLTNGVPQRIQVGKR